MSVRHVPEHALQYIWCHQYIRTDKLRTTDGLPVRVHRPGTVSFDAGPDIRGVRVAIGDLHFSGSAEVHRTAPEWEQHGHHRDPHYNAVVLHILLLSPPASFVTRTTSGRIVPMISLESVLDDCFEDTLRAALLDLHEHKGGRIACSGQNAMVPPSVILPWIGRLAAERLEIKLRRCEERLRELAQRHPVVVREHTPGWDLDGDPADIPPPDIRMPSIGVSDPGVWDQMLYEVLLEGLGYSRNRLPFMTLSRILPLATVRRRAPDDIDREALLFGCAGLIPSVGSIGDAEGRAYVHSLQCAWKSRRDDHTGPVLTPADWVSAPARPSNSPVVRLVAARALIRKIVDEDLFRRLLICAKHRPASMRREYRALLSVEPGRFWERRTSFSRVVPGAVQPLGPGRRDDLIVNGIAPLLLLYARVFRDGAVRSGVLHMLETYPALQPNGITRRMQKHLLEGKTEIRTALQHQGVLQLFNYYCSQDRCRECEIGRIVWGPGAP